MVDAFWSVWNFVWDMYYDFNAVIICTKLNGASWFDSKIYQIESSLYPSIIAQCAPNTATQFKWNDKVKLFKSFIWWAMCLWQKNISLVSHLTLQKLLVGGDHGDAHKKDKERKIAFEFSLILLLFKTFSTLFTKSFVLSAILRLWW